MQSLLEIDPVGLNKKSLFFFQFDERANEKTRHISIDRKVLKLQHNFNVLTSIAQKKHCAEAHSP